MAPGKAAPGLVDIQAGEIPNSPTLMMISSGIAPPTDTNVAVQYNGRWFWLAATDIRSKYTFGSLMLLLFSISGRIKGNGTRRHRPHELVKVATHEKA